MTNKIIILDDSVILYEHYINDEQWERTFAFPRGGLTYLISNGTIKFYAYEDYFYRNCLISMQLPIYIVDEHMHIDGEYSDITALTEILDRIFSTNDIDVQLDKYLKIVDAELLYQPIGDYLTKASADTLYMPIGEYVTDEELVEALEDYYTKDEADEKYQEKLIAGENITISGNVISAASSSGTPVDAYTKAESDARFQPIGNYLSGNALSGYATEQWVLNQKYITSSSTVFNNYYTTANTYNKTEINNLITNLQNQISALTEAINECCSCDVQYRWITLTSSSDYICDYQTHTKYEKQQKQQSTNCGRSWTNVVPSEYQRGSIIETNSEDCGYEPEGERLIMTDATGGTYTLYCGYGTNYLDVHGMKDFTYYDGVSVTKLSGFLPESTWQTIREVELGNCLETLGGQVFMDYSGLTTVTIPNTFKRLGSQGYGNFENCVALENINIPDSVYYIGADTFKGCTNLKSVTIGSGVEEIYDYSFSGCTSLTSITINAVTPPTVTDKTFASSNNCILYVPAASVETYKTANVWSMYYADRIQPIP